MPSPTAYFDFHDRVAKLRDNRLVAKGVYNVLASNGCNNIVVRVPDLRYIEEVLHVQFKLTDFDCSTDYLIGPEMNKKIIGNLVGFSLYVVTRGRSLDVTVIAIGPP